jgi:hypothetical protein
MGACKPANPGAVILEHPLPLGEIGGHRLEISAQMVEVAPHQRELRFRVALEDVPMASSTFREVEVSNAGLEVVRSLENRVTGIPASETKVQQSLEESRRAKDAAAESLGKPFAHTDALEHARHRSEEIDALLRAQSRPAATGETTSTGPSAPPPSTSAGPRLR